MILRVMNRHTAKKHSYNHNIPKTLIISINEWDDELNRFDRRNPNLIAVLPLQFDDVDGNNPMSMTKEDARKIINFVNMHIDKVEEIVVHCKAGQSRSAGTCAALMRILLGDDRDIFESPKYTPNMHCYNTVLNAYYGVQMFGQCIEEGIEAEKKANIENWKANN